MVGLNNYLRRYIDVCCCCHVSMWRTFFVVRRAWISWFNIPDDRWPMANGRWSKARWLGFDLLLNIFFRRCHVAFFSHRRPRSRIGIRKRKKKEDGWRNKRETSWEFFYSQQLQRENHDPLPNIIWFFSTATKGSNTKLELREILEIWKKFLKEL